MSIKPADPSPEAQAPPETNGFLIRLVGKHLRIPDWILHSIEWAILSTVLFPILCFKLLCGRTARPDLSLREFFWQLFGPVFGIGTPPKLKSWVRGPPLSRWLTPESRPSGMLRFVCLSDTHNQHESINVPEGDVLVHCGDCTNHGSLAELRAFLTWFAGHGHRHKILLPGNHDMLLDQPYYEKFWADWSHAKEDVGEVLEFCQENNIQLLIDEGVEVEGVRVYGSPRVPSYASWQTAFDCMTEEDISGYFKRIPSYPDVDVLLTHSPPFGILDRETFGNNGGCRKLLGEVVGRVKPQYHVFGHVHTDWGGTMKGETRFVNAANVSMFYSTRGRGPLCFEVKGRS